jgi:hypothetical protein
VESCRADHVSTVGEQTRTCTRQKGVLIFKINPFFSVFCLIITPIVVVKFLAMDGCTPSGIAHRYSLGWHSSPFAICPPGWNEICCPFGMARTNAGAARCHL